MKLVELDHCVAVWWNDKLEHFASWSVLSWFGCHPPVFGHRPFPVPLRQRDLIMSVVAPFVELAFLICMEMVWQKLVVHISYFLPMEDRLMYRIWCSRGHLRWFFVWRSSVANSNNQHDDCAGAKVLRLVSIRVFVRRTHCHLRTNADGRYHGIFGYLIVFFVCLVHYSWDRKSVV